MNDVTDVFPVILEELRGTTTKTEAADGIGISRVALGYYESGERRPDIEILSRIAEYYHVSTDYLLGLTKVKNPDPDVRAIAEKTGLSQLAIDTIRNYNEDCLTALNFLIENRDFGEALSHLEDYKYKCMHWELLAIAFREASSSGEKHDLTKTMRLFQADDSKQATELHISKSFERVIDAWIEEKEKQVENLSPEEMEKQLIEYDDKIGLG